MKVGNPMANKDFSEYVRKLRTERNYSLKQLADEIEITTYYLRACSHKDCIKDHG